MQFSAVKEKLSLIGEKLSLVTSKISPMLKYARFVWFPMLFLYLEFILHLFAIKSFSPNFIWVVLFSVGLGSFFTFLTTVFPKVVNTVLTFLFTFAFTLMFLAELIYFQIFRGFAHASAIKMGGQAITNFTGGLIEGIKDAIWWIILILLPLIVLTIFTIRLRPSFRRIHIIRALIPFGVFVVVIAGTIGSMAIFFSNGPLSVYRTFLGSGSINKTMIGVENFGLNMTVINEVRSFIFPEEKTVNATLSDAVYDDDTTTIDKNVDFVALYEKAGDNETLKNITAELSNIAPTSSHEYTGLCEGYNLIAICAEAFSPVLVDPITTPTLYKLMNNGFVFNNFYASFPNTTTNGEYTFLMGLYPDLDMGKTDSSFGLSTTNYLPYCYGNLFKKAGANAYAFHNYVGEFYYRNQTHPNMGYEFKAANSGLDIEMTSPTSDFEMMSETITDLAYSGERFVAYYMTYSGHYPYGPSNAMSVKNLDSFDSGLSDTAKAYIACNLELENGLSYIMETLEAAGIADKTMIVLTTDHYPYGLTDDQYAELAAHAGIEINDVFDKQKNSFICYVPGIESVQVDSYCSTIDILPTVLNLLGFDYDSRLLMGQDILAPDAEHVAILADGSFITDGISYIASKMTFEYDNYTKADEERANALFESVERKFRLSTEILHNDYYSFVFDTDSSSEAIDNFTADYKDVDIMLQSAVYYIVTNDIMDPVSEDTFGIYKPATILEVIDSLYRIAGRPEIDASATEVPFAVDDEYKNAVAWAVANGILYKDKYINVPLTEQIKLGQFALLVTRAADYFGMDTSVDPALTEKVQNTYKNIDPEIIRASLFCRDTNIITSVYGNENYVFNTTNGKLSRDFTATSLYRFCSYYIKK